MRKRGEQPPAACRERTLLLAPTQGAGPSFCLVRVIDGHSPSNEEIEAGESANPDSLGYPDRMTVSHDAISQADWFALESGSPDFR